VTEVHEGKQLYTVKYLNSGSDLQFFNNPGMMTHLTDATPIEDFGVILRLLPGYGYSCVPKSNATYEDGQPRYWQEWAVWEANRDVWEIAKEGTNVQQ
jgi:hypothetical protein